MSCRWTRIVSWLEHNGYNRSSTVREPGEYAVRGGILDLFPAGLDQPVRFDFFGDSLESIRSFDAETQRTLLRHALARSGADLGISAGHRNHPPFPDGLCRGVRRAGARRSAVRGGQRRPPPSRHGALAAAVPGADGHAVRLSRRRADRDRAAERGRRARALQADRRLLRGAARGAGASRRRRGLQAACRRTGCI